MTREELIKHIQEKATNTDLVRIANVLGLEVTNPDNINGKYFYIEDDYAKNYVKVIDSNYNSECDEYDISKCIFMSEDDISLYDDIDPINLMRDKEISKEKFESKFNEVLAKILKNL